MYRIDIPYTDYNGKAKRKNLTFNLDVREVFSKLVQLRAVFDWLKDNKEAVEERSLSTEEVVEFYNNLEAVILEAYGEMTADGERFVKTGRYEFEDSAAFNATMWMFVDRPNEAVKLLEGLLPKEMFEMVKNATPEQLAAAGVANAEANQTEIARLQAELEAERAKNAQ